MEIQDHIIFRPPVTQSLTKSELQKTNQEMAETDDEEPPLSEPSAIIPRSSLQLEKPQVLQKIQNLDKNTLDNQETLLNRILNKSSRVIASISSVFPFDFFPDTIEAEEDKVTVIIREFFGTSETLSVDMPDIADVIVDSSPFFAKLKIITRNYIENNVQVGWLKKHEAVHMRNIICALKSLNQERVDTSTYELKDLVKKLQELNTINIVMHKA